jgi:2-methylisocitrate lyase-like PEP mutase family enzyme
VSRAPGHIARLRALLQPGASGRRLISAPGCWDGLTARMIEEAGFEAAFLTGAGLAFTRFGLPDLELVTAGEVAETVAAIRDRIALPLIVDADTGFGSGLNVARTVRRFERAGASAIQLEDQVSPKRGGHLARRVIDADQALARLHAALDSREHALVVARTDAFHVEGLQSALDRADRFVEAGADLVFVEGPGSCEDIKAVAARCASRVALVHNLTARERTAAVDEAALQAMGYAVALHPLALLPGLVRTAGAELQRLRRERTASLLGEDALAMVDSLVGTAELLSVMEAADGH